MKDIRIIFGAGKKEDGIYRWVETQLLGGCHGKKSRPRMNCPFRTIVTQGHDCESHTFTLLSENLKQDRSTGLRTLDETNWQALVPDRSACIPILQKSPLKKAS